MSVTPIDKDDPRGLRAEVRRHKAAGRQTVPFEMGKKGPVRKGWHLQEYAAEDHNPNGNVGLILGPKSGNLINVDCDCKEAVELAALILPPTGMISGRPGRGRSHYWYRGDEALDAEAFKDADPHTVVEFRSSSGAKGYQTVIPPSIHPTGEAYEWYADGDPASVTARDLHRSVRRIAGASLLVRAFPKKSRHDFALALSGALCEADWREADALSFVRAVCMVGGSDAPDARAATVGTTYRRAAAKEPIVGFQALAKFVDSQTFRLVSKWLGLRSALEQLAEDAYTKDEIQALAQAEGVDVAELGRRWVVQRGRSYYLLTQRGYCGPYESAELGLVIRQYLGRAPIRRVTYSANGNARPMSPSEIVEKCGSSVDRVVADLTIERSKYDVEERTLYEAVCPLRKLEPVYDAQIDEWLKLLGGVRQEKLLDWIATSWDLSRQTSALYLSGKKGVGKSMLAQGLARLWTTGSPPALEDVVGDGFNSSLLRCPLVFGDEIVRAPDSATLRSYVGSSGRTLKRKFLADADLVGAPRLVLAGNRQDLLRFDKEDFSEDDREAIASRFLHVHCDVAARDYLESIGGLAGTMSWVVGDRIAQHAAWLALNRVVAPGARFVVEGDAAEMADQLAVQGEVRGLVAEAVCKALDQAASGKAPPPGGFFAEDGELWINASWLHDNWNLFVGMAHRVPSVRRIGTALRGMSEGETRRIGPMNQSRPLCYSVKVRLLVAFAEEVGIGDTERMITFVEKNT